MKIISWNVNGIRAVIKKGFLDFLKKEKPDVLCLQETKIAEKDINKEFSARGGPASSWNFPGYTEYWNPAQRPGYSGTAILVKSYKAHKVESKRNNSPLERGEGVCDSRRITLPFIPSQEGTFKECVFNGFGVEKFDREGRVQTLDLGQYFLVNAYFPNANHELSRLDYKLEFNYELLKYLKKLDASASSAQENKKPIIICGDFNVAHEEIDLARPKENVGNPGFTDEERAWMTKFLKAGFVDIWRKQNPKKIQYTWWSYRAGARPRNIGWRIDYFCASANINNQIRSSSILDKVQGSDHCPVVLEIKE